MRHRLPEREWLRRWAKVYRFGHIIDDMDWHSVVQVGYWYPKPLIGNSNSRLIAAGFALSMLEADKQFIDGLEECPYLDSWDTYVWEPFGDSITSFYGYPAGYVRTAGDAGLKYIDIMSRNDDGDIINL